MGKWLAHANKTEQNTYNKFTGIDKYIISSKDMFCNIFRHSLEIVFENVAWESLDACDVISMVPGSFLCCKRRHSFAFVNHKFTQLTAPFLR